MLIGQSVKLASDVGGGDLTGAAGPVNQRNQDRNGGLSEELGVLISGLFPMGFGAKDSAQIELNGAVGLERDRLISVWLENNKGGVGFITSHRVEDDKLRIEIELFAEHVTGFMKSSPVLKLKAPNIKAALHRLDPAMVVEKIDHDKDVTIRDVHADILRISCARKAL